MPEGGICAHQGDNAALPANTVPAFKSAADKGAAMVEMDVKLLHDAGAKINDFGCNEPTELQKLLDLGVDFILTDELDEMQAKYKELTDAK